MNMQEKRKLTNMATHLTLIVVCIIMLFPAFWIFSASFKTEREIERSRVTLLPEEPTLGNYEHIFSMEGTQTRLIPPKEEGGRPGRETLKYNLFLRWARNSLLIAVSTTVIGVSLAATAAYAFSRFQFIGRRPALMAFLVTQMFPGAVLIIPLYNILNDLNLLDKWEGLVLAYCTTALPFSVWTLKGYFDSIPYDLEEAAVVDGTSYFGAYWRIALPLTLPGLAVTSFYNFMTAWNEFMLALTFMTGDANKTLPVGLRNFVFQFETSWHYFSAGAVLVTLPVMIGFLYAQRFLMSGLTSGGVKG
jgi:arabinogalactan oligomer/maltooligosaccharide transport system permease protein